VKLYVRFLNVFLGFFKIQKNMTFYVFELLHTFSPTVLYTMHFDNSAAYERKTEDKAARHTVYPQKTAPQNFLLSIGKNLVKF